MVPEFIARLSALLSHPKVLLKRDKTSSDSPDSLSNLGMPPDLAAFYSLCDGLELRNGTRILPKSEIIPATEWLKQEKALVDWPSEYYLIGEQSDLIIVRDIDARGIRAGGGVLVAPTDGLSNMKRVSLHLIGFLESLILGTPETDAAPEKFLQQAVIERNEEQLSALLSKNFYPGSERERAQASLVLGVLRVENGDGRGAMEAFEQCARLRGMAARRGARELEMAQAFHSCAKAAEKAGSAEISEACKKRAAYYSK